MLKLENPSHCVWDSGYHNQVMPFPKYPNSELVGLLSYKKERISKVHNQTRQKVKKLTHASFTQPHTQSTTCMGYGDRTIRTDQHVCLLQDASGHSNVLKAGKAEELKNARKRRTASKAN